MLDEYVNSFFKRDRRGNRRHRRHRRHVGQPLSSVSRLVKVYLFASRKIRQIETGTTCPAWSEVVRLSNKAGNRQKRRKLESGWGFGGSDLPQAQRLGLHAV